MKHFQFVILFFLTFSVADVWAQFDYSGKIPKDTTYNILRVHRQIKKDYPYAVPVKDSIPAGVVAFRDLVYAHMPETPFGARDLHLDVFRPEEEGSLPALVLVHGGGWRAGDRSMQVPLAQMIASRGFVTVTVEYQLSLEAKFPAAVHNIKAAIRWMRANAEKYGIDPDRIAIGGASAGGQLAMLVGMTPGVESFEGNMGNESYSSAVQAVIDIDGVVDFMAPMSLNLNRKPDSPDIFWLEGSFYDRPDRWKDASSIYWANEKSVPVLFLNSGFSRFHAGQDELIGMMKEWGIYTEVHKFDVKVHPFWLFHPWIEPTSMHMVAFLRKIFDN